MFVPFMFSNPYLTLYIFFPDPGFLVGISLVVAIQSVRKGAAAEGMTVRDYIWRGHDPTAVAVMTEVTNMLSCAPTHDVFVSDV